MPWRLHLSNRAIRRLDVLPNTQQPLLAAWTQPGRVAYFDLQTGAALGERRFDDLTSRLNDSWQGFLEELKAPGGALPPVVPAAGFTLYLDQTGQQRIHHLASGEVRLLSNGQDVRLSGESPILAAAFDRAQTTVAMLDSTGKLHLRPKQAEITAHDLGLPALDLDLFIGLTLADGGGTAYVAYDRQLLSIDQDGRLRKRLKLHYPLGAFASSPDGRLLVCSDRETNVIRVYDSDLVPLHQRHAVDLMARATQVQLIADPPPSMITLHMLAVDNNGTLAFALAGVVCVSDVTQMLTLTRQAADSNQEP